MKKWVYQTEVHEVYELKQRLIDVCFKQSVIDDCMQLFKTLDRKHQWRNIWAAGVSVKNLVYYYQTVIRPVLEYTCQDWHSVLTEEQAKIIETSSAVCFRLSSEMFRMMKPRRTLNVSTLSDRRVEQCKTLFKQITNQSHILHRLLPAKRDAQLIGRLRSAKLCPTCHARTARFLKSFIPYSLANFQWPSVCIYVTVYVSCRRCILCV